MIDVEKYLRLHTDLHCFVVGKNQSVYPSPLRIQTLTLKTQKQIFQKIVTPSYTVSDPKNHYHSKKIPLQASGNAMILFFPVFFPPIWGGVFMGVSERWGY